MAIIQIIFTFLVTRWLCSVGKIESWVARCFIALIAWMMLPTVFHELLAAVGLSDVDVGGWLLGIVVLAIVVGAGYARFAHQKKAVFSGQPTTSPKRRIDRV